LIHDLLFTVSYQTCPLVQIHFFLHYRLKIVKKLEGIPSTNGQHLRLEIPFEPTLKIAPCGCAIW